MAFRKKEMMLTKERVVVKGACREVKPDTGTLYSRGICRWVCRLINIFATEHTMAPIILVVVNAELSTDDKLREELVRKAVEVPAIELSFWTGFEVGFVLGNMFPHLRHSLANSDIIIEQLTVSPSLPLRESRQFLRNSMEQPNNNSNWGCLHIVTELIDSR